MCSVPVYIYIKKKSKKKHIPVRVGPIYIYIYTNQYAAYSLEKIIKLGAQKRTGKYDGGSCDHWSFTGNQVDVIKRPNPASE
jgi:hypothetical protein